MRVTGFAIVVATFVAVAILADVIIQSIGWDTRDFALIAAAITGGQIGAVIWHKQQPGATEQSVKLGLGVALAITAVAFSLIYQSITGWLRYPEVVVPIAAVGCFVFPFGLVGPMWKGFNKKKVPERHDDGTVAAPPQAPER